MGALNQIRAVVFLMTLVMIVIIIFGSFGKNIPTLDIIIECKIFVLVLLEQSEGIVIGKIFKLNQCILSIPTTYQGSIV